MLKTAWISKLYFAAIGLPYRVFKTLAKDKHKK